MYFYPELSNIIRHKSNDCKSNQSLLKDVKMHIVFSQKDWP